MRPSIIMRMAVHVHIHKPSHMAGAQWSFMFSVQLMVACTQAQLGLLTYSCTYIHTYSCTYIHTEICVPCCVAKRHAYIYCYIHIYLYTQIYVHTHTHAAYRTNMYIFLYMYAYTYICIYTEQYVPYCNDFGPTSISKCIQFCRYEYMYVCIHTHTHTHTYIYTQASPSASNFAGMSTCMCAYTHTYAQKIYNIHAYIKMPR
jgi:hypothetical protein